MMGFDELSCSSRFLDYIYVQVRSTVLSFEHNTTLVSSQDLHRTAEDLKSRITSRLNRRQQWNPSDGQSSCQAPEASMKLALGNYWELSLGSMSSELFFGRPLWLP